MRRVELKYGKGRMGSEGIHYRVTYSAMELKVGDGDEKR